MVPGVDLAKFAEARPSRRGSKCWVCELPERVEIDAAKREGRVSVPQIIDWLVVDKGYRADDVRRPRLNSHFQSGHHKA